MNAWRAIVVAAILGTAACTPSISQPTPSAPRPPITRSGTLMALSVDRRQLQVPGVCNTLFGACIIILTSSTTFTGAASSVEQIVDLYRSGSGIQVDVTFIPTGDHGEDDGKVGVIAETVKVQPVPLTVATYRLVGSLSEFDLIPAVVYTKYATVFPDWVAIRADSDYRTLDAIVNALRSGEHLCLEGEQVYVGRCLEGLYYQARSVSAWKDPNGGRSPVCPARK